MFFIGQRWYSEAEPELGLGIITQLENKIVQIYFAEANEHRSYGTKSAPLKRFKLQVGDPISCIDNNHCEVVAINVENEIFIYTTKTTIIPETRIVAQINISGPVERLLIQNFDGHAFYQLRYQAYLAYRNYQLFHLKGFLGAKINFIPHQIYICEKILNMDSPKVMLCDEVGLGKTIEAGITLHSLFQRELISNAIILVPESLTNQWFIELFKKFSLNFSICSMDEFEAIDFEKTPNYIVSTSLLKNDENFRKQILNHSWDAIVVDESHQIPFFDVQNEIVKLIKEINNISFACLFLSATPEILGLENLFYQLNILDPERYPDLESFKIRNEQFKEVSQFIKKYLRDEHTQTELDKYIDATEQKLYQAKEDLVRIIADRYGAGRNYFRNSRSHLEKFNKLFTKRKLKSYPIESKAKLSDSLVLKLKTDCLLDVIKKIGDKKLFVICQSRQIIQKVQRILLEVSNFKIASFHSEQSLLERDRQAAYFADADGAQILLATQLGSEGRNFEFAHHMFLFDLPKLPDQLEQRIGRLDRIGQLNDIEIHVPYIVQSFEEVLFRWYNDVLGAFEAFPKGGNNFYQIHQEEVKSLLQREFDPSALEEFINVYKQLYYEFKTANEQTHDLLLEIGSYNPKNARDLIQKIENFEAQNPCLPFLEHVFNEIGVEIEVLNSNSFFVKPSHNMLIPSYPGLISDGLSITFDRDYANHHQQVDFVSWEHPIVKTALELTLNSTLGNLCIVATDELPRNIYFEFILTLQCSDQFKFLTSTYLPYTPLRVLLDITGQDQTQKISKKQIDSCDFTAPDASLLEQLKSIPKASFEQLSAKAIQIANARSSKYKTQAHEEIKKEFTGEIQRIKTLLKNEAELALKTARIEEKSKNYSLSIENAKIQLDSLRVILPKN